MLAGIQAPFIDYGYNDSRQFEMVKLIDKLGYDILWARDVVFHDEKQIHVDQIIDPFTYLAYCAPITERIKLATAGIILGHRHPLLVAKSGASLDLLTNGRFILGVCHGVGRGEFEAMGVDPGRRHHRLAHGVRIIRKLWKREPFHETLEFGSFDNQIMLPEVSGKGPEIWMVGGKNISMPWLVNNFDGWFFAGTGINDPETNIQQVRQQRNGDKLKLTFNTNMELLEDDNAPLKIYDIDNTEHWVIQSGGMSGGRWAIIEELKRLSNLGVHCITIRRFVGSRSEREQIIHFAQEVMPHIR